MELTRRFVFTGNASALSGQIYRPKTIIVETSGASSLGVSGGRSVSQVAGASFEDIVKFGSAFTLAEGLFDEEARARDVTNAKGRQEDLTSTTTVTAEIRDAGVGRDPIFAARRIRGTLVSKSPDASGEPSIAPARDTVIQGVTIGRFGLEVTLNLPLFQRYDTHAKLVAAATNPRFVETSGKNLLMTATIEGQRAPSTPRLIETRGVIYATIVRDIRWTDRPYPGAKIDGNSVVVPDFGTVFFGELLISSFERRLTMVRFQLGSPIGGFADLIDIESNGGFFP